MKADIHLILGKRADFSSKFMVQQKFCSFYRIIYGTAEILEK